MFKNMKKQLNNEKGLTLIELLAVIVILAIIAVIAVPAIGNIISNSEDKAKLATASNILAGAKIAALDGACGVEDADGDIECTDKAKLAGYVENVKDETNATYSAKRESNEWSVTYSGLKAFGSKKYKDENITSTLTEEKLNELLDK
jgi:type IV pilus assembly protein PilA